MAVGCRRAPERAVQATLVYLLREIKGKSVILSYRNSQEFSRENTIYKWKFSQIETQVRYFGSRIEKMPQSWRRASFVFGIPEKGVVSFIQTGDLSVELGD